MAQTFSFIGLGLIGGSIAKALKQAKTDCVIKAYDIDRSTLSTAQKESVVDEIYSEICTDLLSCDFLFLCAPVSKNDTNLIKIKELLPASTIITDVGSVKQTTHKVIEEIGLGSHFIGGHPMAGSEKIGYENANPLLLENAYYILTPTDSVPSTKVETLKKIVTEMGAIPLILSYEKHDYITAAVSHVPHIIAASLVNLVKDSDDKDSLMKLIAAGGFKDITRIASSSPVMWQSICMTNTDNIKNLLHAYIESLLKIEQALDQKKNDELYRLFDTAKEYRDGFVNGNHGPIKKVYAIHVDIPDVPGSIAQTATLLALRNLSIQNIGIMHAREFQEGALRIEFYDEPTMKDAIAVLKQHNYKIYD